MWTPTRRHWGRPGEEASCRCTGCGFNEASARHLWAECHCLDDVRRSIEEDLEVEREWWAAQPKVTSKSGWVTRRAAESSERRAIYFQAACRMGIAVTRLEGEEEG